MMYTKMKEKYVNALQKGENVHTLRHERLALKLSIKDYSSKAHSELNSKALQRMPMSLEKIISYQNTIMLALLLIF